MRCVVAGSGITGLTVALLLARQGHDVAVLEAGPRVAPLLRGFGAKACILIRAFTAAAVCMPGAFCAAGCGRWV